jgi:hypothetical protein
VTPQDTIEIADRACLNVLGEATQYSDGGPAVAPVGIFEQAYIRISAGQNGVQSSGPAVFYLLEDLPSDPQLVEPTIVIRGTSYKVIEVKKDGQGGVLVHLHRG